MTRTFRVDRDALVSMMIEAEDEEAALDRATDIIQRLDAFLQSFPEAEVGYLDNTEINEEGADEAQQ